MSRVQLALNVNDIDEAVSFYAKLFGTEPAKRKPGYANFAIAEPPLKLVLLENPGQGGTLNHLGIEVADADSVDAEQAEALAQKIRDDAFTLEDFASQLKQLRSMGPLGQLMDMVPMFKGAKGMPKELDGEERDLGKFEAMIGSMTLGERQEPSIINGSRRLRIARGSGTSVQEVNLVLKQYIQMKQMMKQYGSMAMRGKLRGLGKLGGLE